MKEQNEIWNWSTHHGVQTGACCGWMDRVLFLRALWDEQWKSPLDLNAPDLEERQSTARGIRRRTERPYGQLLKAPWREKMTPALNTFSKSVAPAGPRCRDDNGGRCFGVGGLAVLHAVVKGWTWRKALYIGNLIGGCQTLWQQLQDVNTNPGRKINGVGNEEPAERTDPILGQLGAGNPKFQRWCDRIQLNFKIRGPTSVTHVDNHVNNNGTIVGVGAGLLNEFRHDADEEGLSVFGIGRRSGGETKPGDSAPIFTRSVDLKIAVLLDPGKEQIVLNATSMDIWS
jgi:hypothetical protein